MSIILLDPGHGRYGNRSPVDHDFYEGSRMWRLSEMLKDKLTRKGFEVFTTRLHLDDDPSLYERGSMAGRVGADLFLSLHANAVSIAPDGSFDLTKRGVVGCVSQRDLLNNRRLCERFTQALSALMQNPDLGCFYKDYPDRPGVDYYGVLRYAAASGCSRAMILEHGYFTNPEDCAFLMRDENLELLAQSECAVICDHFGAQKMYRVQVGAYRYRVNAERKEAQLKEKGFDCFIWQGDGWYRVQAGAFLLFENAKALCAKLNAQGFETYILYD